MYSLAKNVFPNCPRATVVKNQFKVVVFATSPVILVKFRNNSNLKHQRYGSCYMFKKWSLNPWWVGVGGPSQTYRPKLNLHKIYRTGAL